MRSPGRPAWTAAVLVSCGLVAVGCSRSGEAAKPRRRAPHRVFLVGFDGMDPTLARRFMAEGKLPNLTRLAQEGAFAALQTTQPSESPTAWASFATGVNPGKHNIFDFLVRDFETYMPDLAMVRKEPPEFLWGLVPTKRPRILSTRGGTSFWVHAGRDGIRSVVLTVPVTFPVEGVHHSNLLAGFPLPDVRGTVGTFSYWATDLSPAEAGNTEFGGILERLLFEDGVASTVLVGPDNPVVVQEATRLRARRAASGRAADEERRLADLDARRRLSVPLEVRWSEGVSRVGLRLGGRKASLAVGEWTDWIEVTFTVNALVRVRGMVQLHVVRADRELQLYASPVNLDPRRPAVPISSPEGFSRRLVDEIGLYRTLGWAEATWPLNEGRLDEAAFMADCDRAFADRERIFMKSLERDDWDLYLAVVETTDRVQHMMWRFIDPRHPMYDPALAATWGDAIERTYRKCDDLVGRMRAKLPPDAVVFVMSDHGFHSFRRCVNLNSWLAENGYLVFSGQPSGGTKTPRRPLRPGPLLGGSGLEPDPRLRPRPRADLLQPPRARVAGGIVSAGRGIQRPAGRDRARALSPRRPGYGRAGLRRDLPARRALPRRVPGERAGPAGRLQRRLPGRVAGHTRRDPAGRRREQHEEVERGPLRDRPRDQRRRPLHEPPARARGPAHPGLRPHDPEAARGPPPGGPGREALPVKLSFRARPIGVVRSPWTKGPGTPIQPLFAEGARGQVAIDARYAEALTDIEGFDRLWLIYWLDRAGPYRPLVTPYLDDRPHGVLATRSPTRPNPIGLSVVRLLGRSGCTLEVADVDVLDGTPLLDLKPYVPRFDAWTGRAGWVDDAPDATTRDDGRFDGTPGSKG